MSHAIGLVKFVRTIRKHLSFGLLSSQLLCFPATADSTHVPLPANVIMNKGAGRGDWLIVKVRLESGEESPFIVDTGSPGSVLDKSFEPRLGTRLHLFTLWSMYGKQESGLYAAPKLYLGNVPLVTDRYIATYDFKKASALRRSGIMGILGMDCLARYCIQLDFEAGTMRFLKADQVNPAELGKAFPLVLSSSLNKSISPMDLSIHHTGLFGGSNTNLMIDTGYNNDGAIENGVIRGHYLTRLVHFFIRCRDLRVGKCVWDDQTYTKLRVGTGWNVLGLRFLARHLVTFDFPKRTMYLKQTSIGPLSLERRTPWCNMRSEPGQSVVVAIHASRRVAILSLGHESKDEDHYHSG